MQQSNNIYCTAINSVLLKIALLTELTANILL